jgi:hypothetical protein
MKEDTGDRNFRMKFPKNPELDGTSRTSRIDGN